MVAFFHRRCEAGAANEAIQKPGTLRLDCFVALAPRNDAYPLPLSAERFPSARGRESSVGTLAWIPFPRPSASPGMTGEVHALS
jgi:hypothetical protein